jgi:hypothetical protein
MGSSVSSRQKAATPATLCGLEQSGDPLESSKSGLSGAQSTISSGQAGRCSDLPEARLNVARCAALPDDVPPGIGKKGKDSVKLTTESVSHKLT